jgi:methylated-DNA-protein-cysteine methyltransferase-like protein
MASGKAGSCEHFHFGLPAPQSFSGSEAQMFAALLKAVRQIPRGKVSTYGRVARAAGYPGRARQVVWALRSPAARGAPWHRVVGAGGKILLPGESGMEQRLRLVAEGVAFSGQRVLMTRHEYQFSRRTSRAHPRCRVTVVRQPSPESPGRKLKPAKKRRNTR